MVIGIVLKSGKIEICSRLKFWYILISKLLKWMNIIFLI